MWVPIVFASRGSSGGGGGGGGSGGSGDGGLGSGGGSCVGGGGVIFVVPAAYPADSVTCDTTGHALAASAAMFRSDKMGGSGARGSRDPISRSGTSSGGGSYDPASSERRSRG